MSVFHCFEGWVILLSDLCCISCQLGCSIIIIYTRLFFSISNSINMHYLIDKPLLPWRFSLAAPTFSPGVCSCTLYLTLFSFFTRRKRQLQFLLEGRGRRAGLSPEELRDNGKLLGEGLSRALFNYPSRDCSAESPEVSSGLFTPVSHFSNLFNCHVNHPPFSTSMALLSTPLLPVTMKPESVFKRRPN